MNPQEENRDVRILWFTRNALDALQIRLAIASSGLSCDLHVLDQSKKAVWKACVAMRLGASLPTMLFLECLPGGGVSPELETIRSRPRLRSLPLALLGVSPEHEARAAHEGADAFIRLPDHHSGLAQLGRDIARFYSAHRLPNSEESIARGA